jgi:hypothetical protein
MSNDNSPDISTPAPAPKRRARTKKVRQPKGDADTPQMSLDFWPDTVRAVPNAALRGSLFTISQRRTTAKKRTLIASVKGIEIRVKGERFNQTDLDVWEELLHVQREQALGDQIKFNRSAFLKALGRDVGKAQYEQLAEEITRLRSTTIEVKWVDEGKTFGGGLVSKYFYDEVEDSYIVMFDADMRKLFDGGYTHVDHSQRMKLGNHNLAKWLHRFYSTHAEPLPYKVETIRTLCGSKEDQRLGDFRKLLRLALDKLVKNKSIISWAIDPKTDLLTVRRTPSLSQQRHIQRKAIAANSTAFDSPNDEF